MWKKPAAGSDGEAQGNAPVYDVLQKAPNRGIELGVIFLQVDRKKQHSASAHPSLYSVPQNRSTPVRREPLRALCPPRQENEVDDKEDDLTCHETLDSGSDDDDGRTGDDWSYVDSEKDRRTDFWNTHHSGEVSHCLTSSHDITMDEVNAAKKTLCIAGGYDVEVPSQKLLEVGKDLGYTGSTIICASVCLKRLREAMGNTSTQSENVSQLTKGELYMLCLYLASSVCESRQKSIFVLISSLNEVAAHDQKWNAATTRAVLWEIFTLLGHSLYHGLVLEVSPENANLFCELYVSLFHE